MGCAAGELCGPLENEGCDEGDDEGDADEVESVAEGHDGGLLAHPHADGDDRVVGGGGLVGDAMGSTRVMSLMAFRAFGEQNDYPMASTIAVMMGVVELVVIALVLLWRSSMYKGSTGGKG